MTEEPEIYEPNFIFFKRIFEAFKVQGVVCSEWATLMGMGWGEIRLRGSLFAYRGQKWRCVRRRGFPNGLSPQLTDDVKKEKEKEPEKLDKMENSAVPKKKGFEEEHKDSDDDSSDDEQVRPFTGERGAGTARRSASLGDHDKGFHGSSSEVGWAD